MTKDERKAELAAITKRHESWNKNVMRKYRPAEKDRAFLLELLVEVGEVLETCQARLIEKDAKIAELEAAVEQLDDKVWSMVRDD